MRKAGLRERWCCSAAGEEAAEEPELMDSGVSLENSFMSEAAKV